jgi:hypothetical protein
MAATLSQRPFADTRSASCLLLPAPENRAGSFNGTATAIRSESPVDQYDGWLPVCRHIAAAQRRVLGSKNHMYREYDTKKLKNISS